MNKKELINYTSDELLELMLNDSMLVSKVSLLRSKSSGELAKLCQQTYKRYKAITNNQHKKKVSDLYKSSEDKWNEKYPNSFRYRSPEEICNIIKNNPNSLKLAWNYISPCKANTALSPDLIERTKQGLILYYKSLNEPCYKLNQLLRCGQNDA